MQATLTPEAPTSATVNVSNSTSVIGIEGIFSGTVILQCMFPGGSKWFNVFVATSNASAPVLTPDNTVDYRVHSNLTAGSAQVYFGVTA